MKSQNNNQEIKGLPPQPFIFCQNKTIKCNSCLEEKEEFVSELCRECSEKMDAHLEGEELR
jgi:hypothetical protein